MGEQWRNATDGSTEAAIDDAVQKAKAERQLGNIDRAVAHLLPHVTAPATAGQYVATVAVQYQLEGGDVRGALGFFAQPVVLVPRLPSGRSPAAADQGGQEHEEEGHGAARVAISLVHTRDTGTAAGRYEEIFADDRLFVCEVRRLHPLSCATARCASLSCCPLSSRCWHHRRATEG